MPDVLVTGGGKLNVSGEVTLNAAGAGQVELHVPSTTIWEITRLTVSCTGTSAPMPVAKVYDGPAADAYFIDGTWTGSQDVSDFPKPLLMRQGEYLTATWTGGTPGEVATIRLVGTQTLG